MHLHLFHCHYHYHCHCHCHCHFRFHTHQSNKADRLRRHSPESLKISALLEDHVTLLSYCICSCCFRCNFLHLVILLRSWRRLAEKTPCHRARTLELKRMKATKTKTTTKTTTTKQTTTTKPEATLR